MHRKHEQNRNISQHTSDLCTWDTSLSYLLISLDTQTLKSYLSGITRGMPKNSLSSEPVNFFFNLKNNRLNSDS